MAHVFVTGGNGFMGSRIVRRLLTRGHEVVALVGADLDCENLAGLDVERREFDLLDEHGVTEALEGGELLVHNAACYSFWEPNPDTIYRVNIDGTQHVMRAARVHGYEKIVYTSSTATLTPSINRTVETEESLFDLRSFQGHYKSSKVLAEIAVLREIACGLPVSIVHPTTVVGRGDRRPTPTGTLIIHFLNGIMLAYADTLLNVVDVDDVAEGHVLALEQGLPGRQYILGGENLSMAEVTSILSELTGIPAPRVKLPPRLLLWAGHAAEWVANHVTHRRPIVDVEAALHSLSNRASDSGRARKELGFDPAPARVALAKAAGWFLEVGMCRDRARRRVEADGRLQAFLAEIDEPV
ncbi:MAG: NAD-dependent epimerase/dehydratase family protein [Deltaproteobacteria bacterium]|nr:NAD-dependent epimerase/dehydratase family protein [Deltaproteobacteria bacterium]MBW2361443.1 NAD-dependent epimerase/dehydratase family protein [Deltaproteobacteria bacterium]